MPYCTCVHHLKLYFLSCLLLILLPHCRNWLKMVFSVICPQKLAIWQPSFTTYQVHIEYTVHSAQEKLRNPAIPDGIIWRKFGKHGECEEPGKDGKHFQGDFKNTLFGIQNTLFMTQNTLFVNQTAPNTLFFSNYFNDWKTDSVRAWRTWSWITSRLENVKQLVEAWCPWCIGLEWPLSNHWGPVWGNLTWAQLSRPSPDVKAALQ